MSGSSIVRCPFAEKDALDVYVSNHIAVPVLFVVNVTRVIVVRVGAVPTAFTLLTNRDAATRLDFDAEAVRTIVVEETFDGVVSACEFSVAVCSLALYTLTNVGSIAIHDNDFINLTLYELTL